MLARLFNITRFKRPASCRTEQEDPSAHEPDAGLARLIPSVVRGDVKPKTAHTVAYLVQTLAQAIHISQDEYINAFGTDGWRKSIRNSVKYNHDYRFPPAAEPQPQPAQPQTQVPQPAPTLPSSPPQPAAITSPAPPRLAKPRLRNPLRYPQVVIPSAARNLLLPLPPPRQRRPRCSLPPSHFKPALRPIRPLSPNLSPRRPCLKRQCPPTIQPRRRAIPTSLLQPLHPLGSARRPPPIATRTSTSTTTTVSSSTASPFRCNT
jgi:hypothetical protein